jgi:DNA-binding transcriptional ArsR family regulator
MVVAEQELLDVTDQEVVALSRVFGLLADPTRVRLLLLLCDGEQNVSSLCAALGLPQPTVSHHLGLLRRGGLLVGRRDGKSIYYGLGGGLEFSQTAS